MERWISAGITHIGDIFDKHVNGVITLQYLKEKLNTANVIHGYKLVLDIVYQLDGQIASGPGNSVQTSYTDFDGYSHA